MKQFIVFALAILVFSSCVSTRSFNAHIEKPISVADLKRDVDFVEKKIAKYHPSTDWYLTNEQLSSKFDSIRSVISKPLTPNEFYLLISNPVSSVRQAHTVVQPLMKKLTRKEAKVLKSKGIGPFSQLKMIWMDELLFIKQNTSIDSTIKIGTKIVSIDGISPQELYNKYKNTFASDGFNQTWIPKKFNRSLATFYTLENGIKDSIVYELSYKDSVFVKTIHRKELKKSTKSNSLSKDSLTKTVKKVKPNREDSRKRKDSMRLEFKNRKIFGYNYNSKIYAKSLKIIEENPGVAILKVSSFSAGQYKKAYKLLFDSIKKSNVQTLILDLRGNTGGFIEDARLLYGYLSNESIHFIQKSKVTSRTSIPFSAYRNMPTFANVLVTPFKPIISSVLLFKTSKDSVGNKYFKIRSENKTKQLNDVFQGDLYVLIDGGSFSASCLLAANLKGIGRGFFVGEETGGAFNGTVAGFMPVFKMPNSKLKIRIGLMDIRPLYQEEVLGRGVFPDFYIVPSVEEVIANDDVQLNWILQKLKS